MKAINFLIKPASSICQMECRYCFYKDVVKYRKEQESNIMSLETAECIINKAIDYIDDYGIINFGFQGGEPTLAGIDFYIKFCEIVEKLKKKTQCINFLIQTNGIIIDQQWCDLFKKYNFLVCVSLDGYKDNHDYFRLLNKNKGSYSQIMKSIRLLENNKISYNILTVITNQLSKHPKKLYEFYKSNNFKYIQFIQCLNNLENKIPYSVNAKEFAQFYKSFFDECIKDFDYYMNITLFEDLISIIKGFSPLTCGFMGKCQPNFIVESNGDVFPCDFYALDKYFVGNINDNSIYDIKSNKVFNNFSNIDNEKNILFLFCVFNKICGGNCKRMRGIYIKDNYCAYKDILQYILPSLYKMQIKGLI